MNPRLAVAFLVLVAAARSQVAGGEGEERLSRLYSEGEHALQAGRQAEAERLFLQLRALAPGTAEVHGRLGLVYYEERKYALAAESFRTALHLKPALPKTDILLALSESELGEHRRALPALEKGFRQANDGELRRTCGLHLLRSQTALGLDHEAVATALELNRLMPKDPEVLYHTSRIYANFAYLNLRELSTAAPQSVWRRQALAEAYESAGNWESAVAEYRALLSAQPDRTGIHYRIGRCLLAGNKGAGAAGDALAEFHKELALDPSNGNAAYEAAELLRKSGELSAAEASFRHALSADSEFPEAQQGLAAVLLAQNRAVEALPLLKAAAASRPEDAVTFYRLSQTYRMLGDARLQARELATYSRLRQRKERAESPLDARSAVTPQRVESPEEN